MMASDSGPVSGMHGPLVAAVDQGTSSTRVMVFSSTSGEMVTFHQEEVEQLYPQEGWVEQDPNSLLQSVYTCISKTMNNLSGLHIDPADIKALGITNQRETTVVWDRTTGQPLHNAIVWLDARTASTVEMLLKETPGRNKEYLKDLCGLPITTYFSALKLRWLFDNVAEVREAADKGNLLFGTVDSWLIWNLSGGVGEGLHMTDVTNASRTMLMNLNTLEWDQNLCKFFKIPMSILPKIRSSSEIFGYITKGPLVGVPISGVLGDQQAALVGQMCLSQGQAKNTYGTGCFLLLNTGTQIVKSDHGLLTTVAYQFGSSTPARYALEGSVAIAGAAVRWLRDGLKLIKNADDIEAVANKVNDTGGVYFVPAFSGLYAPYWRTDARGILCGLTFATTDAHLARATLEAVCFQTRELLKCMEEDSGIKLTRIQVDGGMTLNNLLLQLQADIAGVTVARPSVVETTALGVAMAAGAAKGIDIWDLTKLKPLTTDDFLPTILPEEREARYEKWRMAVERSMNWELPRDKQPGPDTTSPSIRSAADNSPGTSSPSPSSKIETTSAITPLRTSVASTSASKVTTVPLAIVSPVDTSRAPVMFTSSSAEGSSFTSADIPSASHNALRKSLKKGSFKIETLSNGIENARSTILVVVVDAITVGWRAGSGVIYDIYKVTDKSCLLPGAQNSFFLKIFHNDSQHWDENSLPEVGSILLVKNIKYVMYEGLLECTAYTTKVVTKLTVIDGDEEKIQWASTSCKEPCDVIDLHVAVMALHKWWIEEGVMAGI